MAKHKHLLILFLILFLAANLEYAAYAASDPFAPRHEITLWLEKTDNIYPEQIETFLAQAGFKTLTGISEIHGKALISNLTLFSKEQLDLIDSFIQKGGKLFLFQTENYPDIIHLGKQQISHDLAYIEIIDPQYTMTPKVLVFPKNTSAVAIIATKTRENSLAAYLSSDSTSNAHIDPLNSAVIKTDFGLYSAFDWLQSSLINDASFRQLFLYWLRRIIFN